MFELCIGWGSWMRAFVGLFLWEFLVSITVIGIRSENRMCTLGKKMFVMLQRVWLR